MGTTPIFGFPYPDPSDLVANYPALGQQLAEDVEDEFVSPGKIIQIVQATDTTYRSTTSAVFVDVGFSITITPQFSTSKVLLMSNMLVDNFMTGAASIRCEFGITDASNNFIVAGNLGTDKVTYTANASLFANQTLVGYATPGTTSATTYKLRYAINNGTAQIRNDLVTGRLFAMEVTA